MRTENAHQKEIANADKHIQPKSAEKIRKSQHQQRPSPPG